MSCRKHCRGRVLLTVLLLAFSSACERGAGVERVAQRLAADAFPGVPVSYHGGVVSIGDEARPVVAEPVSRAIASLYEMRPVDGVVAADIAVPEDARSGPYTLRVQSLPGSTALGVFQKLADQILPKRVTGGWTLDFAAPGIARLRYEPAPASDGDTLYNLHVDLLQPAPSTLESRAFDLDPGSTLELGYGLMTLPGESPPTRFEALLTCGDARAVLVDEVLAPAAGGRWHDATRPVTEGATGCRLTLSSRDAEGRSSPGAVWTVPRIVRSDGSDDRNIVVISLDTLRADHLSGYGYPRATSPRIDAELIARGTAFSDVTSTYSRTDVSHMSVFTGLYPAARPRTDRLDAATPIATLAERLRDAGFETAAFTEDGLVAGVFGFWFGFDRFTESQNRDEAVGESIAKGTRYVRRVRDRKFFLFLHTYKTHAPYEASEPYRELFRDPAHWEHPEMQRVPERQRDAADAYDRTIREADALVAEFLAELSAQGLADRTIVILLSDHGEAFGEHGQIGHSFTGNEEVIRVPLVIRGPGVPEGKTVNGPASLVDLVPTVLDLLDLPPPEYTQGVSLVPAMRGTPLPPDRPLFFSWLAKDAAGVKRGAWKYMRSAARTSVFNLDEDPDERRPLSEDRMPQPRGERLLAEQASASATLRTRFETAETPSDPAVSEDMEEALRRLGYIE